MKKSLLAFLIAAAPLCLFAQLPSYLPTDGLVGWWPFNGNANDESGNGNYGSVYGAELSNDRTGVSNAAYAFNGISDYIEIQQLISQLNGQATATFSFWVNFSQQDGCILGLWSSCSGCTNVNLGSVIERSGSDKILFSNNSGAGSNLTNDISNNLWNHIVFVFDGNQSSINNRLKCYINGQLNLMNYGIVNNSIGTSTSCFFGRRDIDFGNFGNYFGGKLDDIGIWNRALTPEEITALYTSVPTDNNGGGSSANATVPAAISYQAVARNAQGQPLSETDIQVKFTLLTDSLTGAAEYSESHSLTTNSLGLFTTAFGAGTAETGTFAAINWASGTKYLKVELDAGTGFVDMGTQQLLSVPYSMRSNTSAKAGTIENAGLPVYANNAAALAGGLVAGQMYRTATGDLKIVY